MLDPAFICLVLCSIKRTWAFGESPSLYINQLLLQRKFSGWPFMLVAERGRRYLAKKVSEWAQHLAPSGVLTSRGKTLSLDKRD